jgi:hypothetical protein
MGSSGLFIRTLKIGPPLTRPPDRPTAALSCTNGICIALDYGRVKQWPLVRFANLDASPGFDWPFLVFSVRQTV